MFSIVLTFFIIQFTISIVLFYGSSKSKQYTPLSKCENTTVIIPFKNEGNRISPLLKSINKAAVTHKKTELFSHFQFIFIDDHSIDNTAEVILNELNISYQLIRLRSTEGKKYAIKKGAELADFNRILTLDADVSFDEHYLNLIAITPCEGLTILPVNMTQKKNFISQLNAVEFWFLQRLTFGLSGLKKYALCNGANLLFTKETFNKAITIRRDANIASGDDLYLLKAVNQLQLPVNAFNCISLAVTTPPPISLGELINQRKRWIKKMSDLPSILGGVFVLISNAFFIYSIYKLSDQYLFFLIPLGIKIISEIISVDGLGKKMVTLVHQIIYPFYLTILLVSLFGKENNWRDKGI